MSNTKKIALYSLVALYLVPSSLADTPCLYYRSKSKAVPVFAEASEATSIVNRLKRGQEVCYLGEVKGFAIVSFTKNRDSENSIGASKADIGYVKLSELWPPRDLKQSSRESNSIQEFFDFWSKGGVPDDPLAPFRNLWGGAGPEPRCLAGKICKEVEKKLEQNEQKTRRDKIDEPA